MTGIFPEHYIFLMFGAVGHEFKRGAFKMYDQVDRRGY
jgi:hypothetical protein